MKALCYNPQLRYMIANASQLLPDKTASSKDSSRNYQLTFRKQFIIIIPL